MKKILFLLLLISISEIQAQDSYFENFDQFDSGNYIDIVSSQWFTWSNQPGGGEDALVSDNRSFSGSNSLEINYLKDVLLSFGSQRTSGILTVSFKIYKETGKAAYFNFQESTEPGIGWAAEIDLFNSGNIGRVEINGANQFFFDLLEDSWNSFQIECDLDRNKWNFMVNGECVGTIDAENVGALNFYGTGLNHDFFIDDVSYEWTETEPGFNLENLGKVDFQISRFESCHGDEHKIMLEVKNLGTNDINSFRINYDLDGINFEEYFSGLNVETEDRYSFHTDNKIVLDKDRAVPVVVRLMEVNGVEVRDDCEAIISATYSAFQCSEDKKIFVEESTGNWCPFCTRGMVAMKIMENTYQSRFVGVAVHDSDPMEVEEWSPLPGNYPSAWVERIETRALFSSGIDLEEFLTSNVISKNKHYSSFNSITRELDITVETEFKEDAFGNYGLVVGLIENGVTGYSQENNAPSGSWGYLDGFIDLPTTIPAGEVVFNHTARALLTPLYGSQNDFPSGIIPSGVYIHQYTYVVPDEYVIENMKIVSSVLNDSGHSDNAQQTSIDFDGDGYSIEEGDCDEENALINPGQIEIEYNGIDDDCNPSTLDDDLDQDGYLLAEDCDDNDNTINPGQIEIEYNGIDDDCNDSTLDDDLDEDGFLLNDDCDDTNAFINPDQIEIEYNGLDDDCNELTLDDDLDGDGFGISEDCDDLNNQIFPGNSEIPYNGIDDDCNENTLDDDLDEDGFFLTDDCDDTNPLINPGQTEIVYNGMDDDCNQNTLDDDLDGDGYLLSDDCDDNNSLIYPGAIELCDGIDNNCNSEIDEDIQFQDFYQDLDNDGFGNLEVTINDCQIPAGYVINSNDCNDTDPLINPNALEVPYNGIDEDCNAETLDDDLDEDGFLLTDDCDDTNASINPGQIEIEYNGIDDDCNVETLDDDLDQDGYDMADDCDDENLSINPAAIEIPNNGIDEDCDGMDLISSTQSVGNSKLEIFPNPVSSELFIKGSSSNLIIEFFDLNGKLVKSSVNFTNVKVDDLNNGIYIVKVKDLMFKHFKFEKIVVSK